MMARRMGRRRYPAPAPVFHFPMRLPLLVIVLVLAAAAPASAMSKLQVGISDQKASMFEDERFKKLKVRHARIALPWDAYITKRNASRTRMDAWLKAAKKAKVQPLVSITHSDRDQYKLPSLRQYRRGIHRLRDAHPWLRTFSTWNEANHQSQPTYWAPRRHAQYFSILRQECKGCTILAAELLDSDNLKSYSCRLQHWMPKRRSLKLRWGLHNYQDANPRPGVPRGGTKRFLGLVPGEVWLTETGGIVRFRKNGRTVRKFSVSRAAKALRKVFSITRQQPRIKRVYLYHWSAGPKRTTEWDSGVVNERGKARSTLNVLRAALKQVGRASWRKPRGGTRRVRGACRGVDVTRRDRLPKRPPKGVGKPQPAR